MIEEALVDHVVLPGDILKLKGTRKVHLGPGLRSIHERIQSAVSENVHEEESVGSTVTTVTKAGVLRFLKPNIYFVDSCETNYTAGRNDLVLGVVTNKVGDHYLVTIGTGPPASLSYLAFENATKKNRPDVKVGDLVYARVLEASADREVELVCVNSSGRSGGLGVIRDGGFLLNTTLNFNRRLLNPSPASDILALIGRELPYEVVAGVNGRLWVKGRSIEETLVLVNVLESLQGQVVSNWPQLVKTRMMHLLSGRA